MTDRSRFETRLEERLRARADLASRPFDAAAIAHEAVAVAGWRRGLGRRVLPSNPPALQWLILASLLAIAVLGAVVGVGAFWQERAVPVAPAPEATAQAPGAWTTTGRMTRRREGHTATLLRDGRVLVAGAGSSELYDPSTGSWSASGDMTVARPRAHSATLLPDGMVLVVGGDAGNNAIPSAELYDPTIGTWIATGAMVEAHGRGHTATLLPDGSVLVAGGYRGDVMLDSAELYDPASRSWSATGEMTAGRVYHTATLLPDGTVLVAGSVSSSRSAELYDPVTGTWAATGSMITGRHDFTATLLLDGTVLATAYEGSNGAELYDPGTGTWTATGSMTDVRLGSYTATLLPDGRVLVAGGVPNRPFIAELYDPRTRAWAAAPSTGAFRQYGTATLLPDGTVLVAGGRGGSASVELYDPQSTP